MKNSIDDLTADQIQQKRGLKNKRKDRSLENIQSEAWSGTKEWKIQKGA